ncbi:MAG: sensor histidine kinase [Chloroflexota bacterium]
MAERRSELAIALVPVALAIATLLILLNPAIAPAIVSPRLALAIDATATLVAVAVAALAWVHFQEGPDPAALVRASAFLVFAAVNALFVLVTVAGFEQAFGLSLEAPGQLPLWGVVLGRAVAAGLLVVAGLAALRRLVIERFPSALLLWLPALLVTGAVVVAATVQPSLPTLLDPEALARLRTDPAARLLAAGSPLLVTLQVVIGLGFLWAAALAYQVYRRDRRGIDAFLAVGLMVAAFSQIHFAIHPGTYATLITTGDLLRVAFYALLLVALAAESRGDVRALRRANEEIVRLREIDLARATVEERARLAREIHDGMSQELWYAKLKQGRLLLGSGLPEEARRLAEEVAHAIESALAEARQAIMALRPAEGTTFTQVLERYVEDFADRFGIPADCVCDPALEQLPARAQAEMLRIVQEALNNARKHADATRVHVEGSAGPSGLRLTIADNGHGFNVDQPTTGYGLGSMRERAALIGATIQIESQAQGGTRVVVELPSLGGG